MAANTTPIFPLTPVLSWGAITTANNTYTGIGTVVTLVTAGADGAKVDYIKARALGTNVSTVLRLFINNGADTAVATNNSLFMERALNSTTASTTTETADWIIPCNITLPAGYRITAALATTVAAGWQLTAVSGNF